jgi:hypothetical protein
MGAWSIVALQVLVYGLEQPSKSSDSGLSLRLGRQCMSSPAIEVTNLNFNFQNRLQGNLLAVHNPSFPSIESIDHALQK